MLSDKINTGIKLASRYNDDIIFWAGSNDYVSQDFFEQIIEYYNPNNRQIYGITSFINGNNANFYSKYDEKKMILIFMIKNHFGLMVFIPVIEKNLNMLVA